MGLANCLLLTILLIISSFHFPSHGLMDQETPTHLAQSMILKACENIENQTSCLASIRSQIKTPDSFSILKAALQNTLKETISTSHGISTLNTASVGPLERLAVEDCAELLDFSVTELEWSASQINNSRAGGDIQAWLSAAYSNQDTCLDGFQGTDRRLESGMHGRLSQVTQLIGNVLKLYLKMQGPPAPPPNERDFPKWMSDGDKEMLVSNPKVDAVVALDGTGNYRSVRMAILRAPSDSDRRYVIHVKMGVYNENVDLNKKKTNIMLVGDGIGKTVITGYRSVALRWTTFRTATFAVSGKGFIARDMTFRNTAGAKNFQAVALRVDSDKSAFYRCSMEGYQDTLYAHSLRQFYRECTISGTIDFICGNAAAVFQNCNIRTNQVLTGQKVTITAQGRKDESQSTGFTIQDSHVSANSPTYLGRPWQMYSRTVFINTYLSRNVERKGWLEWNASNFALDTLFYGEYKNYGPGSSVKDRVNWKGYRKNFDARLFTVARLIDGNSWVPATGVPFKVGL